MKTPKWTKADAKRAERMGWRLDWVIHMNGLFERRFIVAVDDRFKSDDEAIEWVLAAIEEPEVIRARIDTKGDLHLFQETCRTAFKLCAKG